ncbi:hypothetical protein CCZ37_07425 [Vibrio qinghaiensis]|uniref:Uncharacterized protein n=1 Tax=Vibrio qinghaiensis TaxID=2025808 RepID=A0A223MXZ6_9VIBR|nr:hypothetical protein [Vibrio qinghaiensis]ASU22430.1 hypothetical protein CCZ37_07425 [Vibrio qinghaiensis]
MKIYKKRYQKILHYYLSKKRLLSHEFFVLTSLTEDEIEAWFSVSRYELREKLLLLGLVVEYQALRLHPKKKEFVLLRTRLEQKLYLWSDVLGLNHIPTASSTILSGLLLLREHNKRHALILAMRLGIDVPEVSIGVQYPYRLSNFIQRVMNSSSI